MDSLTYVRERLALIPRGDFKAIEAATSVKRYTLWRIVTGRTKNPGTNTVEAVRRYLDSQ